MPEPTKPRKLLEPLPARTWTVYLTVTDTPGPGEDYLSKDDIIANVLKRASHPGIAVVAEDAEEHVAEPSRPEPSEEPAQMWPVEPAPAAPAFTTLQPVRSQSVVSSIRRWLGARR